MLYMITFLAGCFTLIGYLFIYLKDRDNKVLISSLAFAGGVMLLISIYDLIPTGFSLINSKYYIVPAILLVSIFFLVGLVFAMILDKYLPTNDSNGGLYRIGIITMLAIIMHNIPEGIATYLTSNHNLNLGINLSIAMALHNIPEGISVAIPIYYSTSSKLKAFGYTLISGMSEFVGALVAGIFLNKFNSDLFMGFLYIIIAGIMTYISIYQLISTSLKYKKYKLTFIFLFIGIVFMYISCQLLK